MRWVKRLGAAVAVFVLVSVLFTTFLHLYRPKRSGPSKMLERKITAVHREDPCYDVTVQPEKIHQINDIFSQHFYFLGQGKQCSAYVSYDGQHVIKFLLQKPLVVKPRFQNLPDYFPFSLLKKYKVHMKEKRKRNLF